MSNDQIVFAMYFASVAGIQYHPANPPDARMSLTECADVALNMLKVHQDLFLVLESEET